MSTLVDVRTLTTRTWIKLAGGSLIGGNSLITASGIDDAQDDLAQRLNLTLRNVQVPEAGGEWVSELIGIGAKVWQLRSEDAGTTWHPWFEGEVTDWDYDADTHTVMLVVHDPLFIFAGHEDQVYYPEGVAGSQVIKDVWEAYGLPIDRIDGPGAPLPKVVYDGAMGELIMNVLRHGLYMGEKAFLPRWLPGTPEQPGKAAIVTPGTNDPIYGFDQTNSLLSAHEHQSSGEMISEVWLVGNESAEESDGRLPIEQKITVSSTDTRPKIGKRVLIKSGDYDTPEAAKQAALTMLEKHREPSRDRSANVLDVPGERKGNVVRLRGGTFDGYYTTLSIAHDLDTRTMQLTVGDRGSALYQAQKFPDPPESPSGGLAGSGADCMTQKMLAYAAQYLGDPYVYGGNGSAPHTPTDCSRFVQNCFNHIGIQIERSTMGQRPNMTPISQAQLRAGDLVYYGSGGGPNEHVALIIDSTGRMINQAYGTGVAYGHYSDHGNINGFYRQPDLAGVNEANCAAEEATLGSVDVSGGGPTWAKLRVQNLELAQSIARHFPSSAWEEAAAVSHCESTWDSSARNLIGETSIGYFQINIDAHGGTAAYWRNTENNVRKAAELWRQQGGSFRPDWFCCWHKARGLPWPATCYQ